MYFSRLTQPHADDSEPEIISKFEMNCAYRLHRLHCLAFEDDVRAIRVFGFGLGKICSMWLCSALDGTFYVGTWDRLYLCFSIRP